MIRIDKFWIDIMVFFLVCDDVVFVCDYGNIVFFYIVVNDFVFVMICVIFFVFMF